MKPIFMASGPDIKSGHKVRPFTSLDIYPLTAALLGIRPAPNNGTLTVVRDMIRGYVPRIKPVMEASGGVANSAGTTFLTAAISLTWKCLA